MDNVGLACFAPVPVEMSRDVLGISWVNGRFHASATNGRAASASWTCPIPICQEWEFALALAEAVTQTDFTGREVMLVLDQRSLLFHLEETPPAADKVVDQLLRRAVERSDFFEEKAAWSRLDLPGAKGRRRFLLALMPEALLRRLGEICDAQNLEFVGVFPLAGVFEETLRSLSVPDEDTVLIAADLGGGFHLVLGKGDGSVLFCRTIASSSEETASMARVAQEINRTVHFARQQFGANVAQLYVMGTDAFGALKDQPLNPGVTVHESPVPEDALYYAGRVAELSPRHTLNLVSALPRAARRREHAVACGIAALLCVSILAAVQVEVTVRGRERAVAINARQLQEQTNAQARQLQEQAARWQTVLQVVGSTNEPSMPELFARYLGQVVPDSIRLTRVDVSRTAAGWACRLEGTTSGQSTDFSTVIAAFDRELQTNFFQVHITDSTHQRVTQGLGVRGNERTFFVAGEIK